jgi:hypothetical protein
MAGTVKGKDGGAMVSLQAFTTKNGRFQYARQGLRSRKCGRPLALTVSSVQATRWEHGCTDVNQVKLVAARELRHSLSSTYVIL